MTNRIAICLVLCIAGFFALDHYVLHLNARVMVMRGLIDAIGYLAFWR